MKSKWEDCFFKVVFVSSGLMVLGLGLCCVYLFSRIMITTAVPHSVEEFVETMKPVIMPFFCFFAYATAVQYALHVMGTSWHKQLQRKKELLERDIEILKE